MLCPGGLGNQMFAYAAGLYFAQKFGKIPRFVKPGVPQQISNGFARPFLLEAFCIRESIREATPIDTLHFYTGSRLQFFSKVARSVLRSELIYEPAEYVFHPELQCDPSYMHTYLKGYWQAAGYPGAIEHKLRKEFCLRAPMRAEHQEYLRQIQQLPCTVSIHMRLGDYMYITHKTASKGTTVSNVLCPGYYKQAIAIARKMLKNPTFIVFSDDPAAARSLLGGLDSVLFVEGTPVCLAHEDLWLMSQCSHHIIANSSFSWWGAWLNSSSEKQVFAPRYWFNTQESYFADLFPSGWTLLDNRE